MCVDADACFFPTTDKGTAENQRSTQRTVRAITASDDEVEIYQGVARKTA